MSNQKKKKNQNQYVLKFLFSVIIIMSVMIYEYICQSFYNQTEDENQVLNISNNIENAISSEQTIDNQNEIDNEIVSENTSISISEIPEYNETPYVEINNNIPYFTKDEYTTKSFEKYSELDEKGRCGVAYANICKETMPLEGEERGDISSIKPTGWRQKKYNGEYLYNRCHLIGYQLSAENANKQNLITGTRYFNVEAMLPFENKVAKYIDDNPNNHVLYRVTPIFEDDNLLANGVEIEAFSVEDNGAGVCFNVYCYNVQPGITINYATGESHK